MTTAKSIRVLVFFASGVEPETQDLETVDAPIRPSTPLAVIHATRPCPLSSELSKTPSYIINDKDKHVDYSEVGPLPDVRQSHNWDEKAWEKRIVLCMAKYHVLVTLEEGKESNPWLPLVSGNIFLLKLSDAEDRIGSHFYEDIDFGDTEEK